jgi:hypothetical protein
MELLLNPLLQRTRKLVRQLMAQSAGGDGPLPQLLEPDVAARLDELLQEGLGSEEGDEEGSGGSDEFDLGTPGLDDEDMEGEGDDDQGEWVRVWDSVFGGRPAPELASYRRFHPSSLQREREMTRVPGTPRWLGGERV